MSQNIQGADMSNDTFPKLDLSKDVPIVMGVINVTSDSFYPGSQFPEKESAVKIAVQMEQEGADILDVGGESTRPGAQAISLEEELKRVIPVIKAIRQEVSIPISIDSTKPEVMREALMAGATLINDVCALQAPGALEVAAKMNAQVCFTHMQGEPRTMQENPYYEDVVIDVGAFLHKRIEASLDAGIPKENIIIDPGFGFGKTVEHNLKLIQNLRYYTQFDVPILIGVSRKSTIGKILDAPVTELLTGSIAFATLALNNGAKIIRTHDVKETVEAVKIYYAVNNA